MVNAPDGPLAGAYAAAATTLIDARAKGKRMVFEVVGSGPGNSSEATANLAVALAQRGKRVIAISGDLREPSLHRFFGLGDDVGLTSLLGGTSTVGEAVQRTQVRNLLLIASGPLPSDPATTAGLEPDVALPGGAPRSSRLRAPGRPSAASESDAFMLAPATDGVVVIGDAADLQPRLEGVGARVVAVVASPLVSPNGAKEDDDDRRRKSAPAEPSAGDEMWKP